ncbi:MAG: hypothetical protein V4632_10775 [Pseudomonadota bacterium]
MSRLNTELDQIDKLSLSDGLSREFQTMLVCAGVIGGLFLLPQVSSLMEGESNTSQLSGPLSPYVVKANAEDQTSCRATACTFVMTQPIAARIILQRTALYKPPPVQIMTAPAGQVFRNTLAADFDWTTSSAGATGAYSLVHLSSAKIVAQAELPESEGEVTVPVPGYVRSIKLANTAQEEISLNGILTTAGANAPRYAGEGGQTRLLAENPPIASLVFQHFDRIMRFELPESPDLVLAEGDEAMIHFDEAPVAEQRGSHRRQGLATQVVKLTRDGSPVVLTVQLALPVEQAMRVLRDRVSSERTQGKIAFPEKMWLEFFPRYGKGADQLLRVPASAIVRNGSDAMVWTVTDEFAIPVLVHEVERYAQSSVIIEKTGARGLPIHAAHWRALSAYGRSRVFLAARHPDDGKLNKLLSPDVRVIEHPTDRLQPGSKVRSGNARS